MYCCIEHRGPLCRMYAAACAMARGMESSATASCLAAPLSISSPSFFCKSANALLSSIGFTRMMALSPPVNLNAASSSRVVTRIEPLWLCGRYADSKGLVSALSLRTLKKIEASSALSSIMSHLPCLSLHNQFLTKCNMSAVGSLRPGISTVSAIAR